MKKENKKRKIGIIITSVALVILLGISFAYAYFSSINKSDNKTVQAGSLKITYSDDNLNTINLSNIAPIHDEDIKTKASKLEFKITNNGSSKAYVDIYLNDIVLPDELVSLEFKWALYSGEEKIYNGNFRNILDNKQLLMNNIELNKEENKTYQLYIWISENDLNQNNMMNKTFSAKILVKANQKKGNDLLTKIIKDNNNPIVTTTPDFNSMTTTDEGLIKDYDDDGETYYFIGNVKDNYVKLGNLITADNTGLYVSNNKSIDGSFARSTITFTPTENGKLLFDYQVSSEKGYDKLTITLNDGTTTNTLVDAISGENSGNINQDITAGTTYKLTFKYAKDGSDTHGQDRGIIKNLSITSVDNPEFVTKDSYGFVSGDIEYKLWRIVRINGDNTIRLMDNDVEGTSKFNTSYNNEKYVGYTYDNSEPNKQDGTPSTIKKYIDNWYSENMANTADSSKNFDKLIANTRFCNDTTVSKIDGSKIYYGVYDRLYTNKRPTYKCLNTTKNYGGEYDLKVGLLNADEASFAGEKEGSINPNNYLHRGTYYWLLSPHGYGPYAHGLGLFYGRDPNGIMTVDAGHYGVVPVVSLRGDTLFVKGDGTKENPYYLPIK